MAYFYRFNGSNVAALMAYFFSRDGLLKVDHTHLVSLLPSASILVQEAVSNESGGEGLSVTFDNLPPYPTTEGQQP